MIAIDPELAETAALNAAYGLDPAAAGNCVVVAGSRGGQERIAACVVAADNRADVNGLVKKLLDVRKASFLAMDRAVGETGMESEIEPGAAALGAHPRRRDCVQIPFPQ